jgi:hypothetical protein
LRLYEPLSKFKCRSYYATIWLPTFRLPSEASFSLSNSLEIKEFTIKCELIIESVTGAIIHLAFLKGRLYGFILSKEYAGNYHPSCHLMGDPGYQGIEKLFESSFSPFKSYKNQPMYACKKQVNQVIVQIRIQVAHTIKEIKISRIIRSKFKNKINKRKIKFLLDYKILTLI